MAWSVSARVPFGVPMSVEGWVVSVTGVIAAVGTVILVFYTPFGPAVRRACVATAASLWRPLLQALLRLGSDLHRRTTLIVAVLILVAAWSLASPLLFSAVGVRPLLRLTGIVGAAVASVLALVIAYQKQPAVGPGSANPSSGRPDRVAHHLWVTG